jgi:predicted O-methyltransferase YrrM
LQRLELAMVPARALDASALNGPLDFESVFGTTPEGWQDDQSAITRLYANVDIADGVNPGDRRALYHLIRARRCRRVLEIGTHIGASTVYLARALRAHGGRMITVDMRDVNALDGWWSKARLSGSPRELVAELGCADVVTFVISDSRSYMRGLKERFDLVFLDGSHEAPNVYEEVDLALQLLAPGGIIVLHDYYPTGKAMYPVDNVIPGPYLAMKRIRRERPGIGVQPLGVLPWPTKQGLNLTNLAAVYRGN